MQFHFIGDNKGFEVRLTVAWQPFRAFVKAALAALGATGALLAAPEIMRLLQLLHR